MKIANLIIFILALLIIPGFAWPACSTVTPWQPSLCPSIDGYRFIHIGSTPISLAPKAAPNWGISIPTIYTMFAPTILYNFQHNSNLNTMLNGMDELMMARMSTLLAEYDTTHLTWEILAAAAQKVSGTNLRRLEAAFGAAAMAYPIGEYASTATLKAYGAAPVLAPFPLSEAWWQAGLGAGVTDSPGQLYLYAVFLDSYTAGAGGPSVVAIRDMQRYMQARVKNVVVTIIVVTAAVLAILDSPTARQVATQVSDWFYFRVYIPSLSYMPPLVISWPPTITPEPTPDPTLPEIPGISDDGDLFDVELCNTQGTC
jgi:hypothetical protein